MLKTCFKCSKAKRRSEFYRHPAMGDGLLGKCKTCTKSDAIAVREKRLDYYRAYDRERSSLPHRKLLDRKKDRRRRKLRPAVHHASIAVKNAIKRGVLVRPASCERCLVKCKPQGHHDHYGKPLEVIWLCPVCHAARHRELGRLG